MAEKIGLFENYLNCYVCSETFTDPVSLSCNHNFCSSCLQKFWEKTGNKNCPVCKRRSSKVYPPVNFQLKELADSYAGRQKSGSRKGEKEEEVRCTHQEETKLFCRDEQKSVCPVCQFSLHQNHKMVPLAQAVGEQKDLLKSDLKSLQDKRDKFRKMERSYNEVIQHNKKQLLSTEKQIRAEFNKLHQFLKQEEESRLAALWKEEEQKMKTIGSEKKMIEEQISTLSDSICAVEKDLKKEGMTFLNSYKHTQSRARVQCSLSDPQMVSGALIDVAKHLGNLSFRVWEKMKEEVHFSPVILDPNTANPWLYMSEDLTSVRQGGKRQQLPVNTERHSMYASVLGSEGFSSGKHSWEVEVGDHPNWCLGLCKESAVRKGEGFATPKNGIWMLKYKDGKYSDSHGNDFKMKKSPQRIRVQLDYDRGELSFYDSEDMTHIYTYNDTFTEKLFPYFGVGKNGNAKTTDIRICQSDISLMFRESDEVISS